MKKASWIEAFPELMHALGQTAWMVGASFVIVTVLGLALGVVLRLSSPDGLNPQPVIYQVVGAIVNIARSLPFLILMIALLSFTRWLVGTELNLVNRLAEEVKPQGKTVQFMSSTVCMCSTMQRIDPQHLAWALENLAAGNVVNRITVPAHEAVQAKLALERMLAIS